MTPTVDTHTQDDRDLRPGAIVAGAILLFVGAGMLLDTTGVTDIRSGHFIAPLVLIAIGISTLLGDGEGCRGKRRGTPRARRRNPAGGLWMIGLGVWMIASQTHLFGLTFGTSWPILIILTGFMIVIRGMR